MHGLTDPSRRHILLVDDEDDILESLQELLEASIDDLQVDTASSGEAGLELLQSKPYDLLVSDYKMPGMDGLALLRAARDKAPSTPRILMTAFPDLQIALDAINDARIENFFTKPLNPTEVVRILEDMLSQRRSRQQRDRAFARAMDLARRRTP